MLPRKGTLQGLVRWSVAVTNASGAKAMATGVRAPIFRVKRKFFACPFCCLLKGFRLSPPLYLLPSETCLVIALLVLLGFMIQKMEKKNYKDYRNAAKGKRCGAVARGVALFWRGVRQGCVEMGWRRFGGGFVCVHEFLRKWCQKTDGMWWMWLEGRRDFNKGGLDVFCAWALLSALYLRTANKEDESILWKCVWGGWTLLCSMVL